MALYAIFGTSRQLVVAVSSAIAVMSASIVGGLAVANTAEFYAFTAALAIMVGLVAIVAGLLRLGRIAQFFSEPVLVGFVSALALVIAIKQVPKLLGLEASHGNLWQRCLDVIQQLPESNWATLAVGATSILLMIFLERRFHRIPAALVAMVYGIVVVQLFNLQALGVHVVGVVPTGLAAPKFPGVTLGQLMMLVPGAIGLTLVMFAEAIGPARSFAGKYSYRINANQELIALGTSNLGAGLFQGFPIGASLSKSAANDAAGGRSQMAGLIAAAATVLVALFLTPLFRNLPEATLAAIVIVAVAGMVKIRGFRWLYKVNRVDFAMALIAFLAVLSFEEVLVGLVVAVVISLLALIGRASQSRLSILGRVPGSIQFDDMRRYPQNLEVPDMLIVRPDEGLFFANAASLREVINKMALSAARPFRTVLVDLEMSNELDATSVHELRDLHKDLSALNLRLALSRVHQAVRDVLDRSELTPVIGEENIYHRGVDAVLAHLEEEGKHADVLMEMAAAVLEKTLGVLELAEPHTSGAERSKLETVSRQVQESIDTMRDE
jgi:high affinity sulfate transporter 1